jgi:hypothetical protein
VEKACGRVLTWQQQSHNTSLHCEEHILQESRVCGARSIIDRIYANRTCSAYEITNIHKREPPPKEILEDVSAKGGDLLNRTVENFLRPTSRETERLRNGDEDSEESDEEGDTKKTPKEDRMDLDEPGSTGRVTRGEHCRTYSSAKLFQKQLVVSIVLSTR